MNNELIFLRRTHEGDKNMLKKSFPKHEINCYKNKRRLHDTKLNTIYYISVFFKDFDDVKCIYFLGRETNFSFLVLIFRKGSFFLRL